MAQQCLSLRRPPRLEYPPDDPAHVYYLTYCYVCSEEAKTEHIRNYGAIVCFSCRAFWRRTFQKEKRPDYACKKDGQCVLTVENRRSCQKCRLTRCSAAGMIAEAVLSEEQKEVRFQKFYQKKKNQSLVKTEPEEAEAEAETGSPPPQRKRNRKRKVEVKYEVTSPVGSPPAAETSGSSFDDVLNFRFKQSMQDCRLKILGKLQPKIDDIVSTHRQSIKYSPTDFVELTDSNAGRRELLNYFVKISDEFQSFAFSTRQFSRLPSKDQQMLVAKNSPLYVQMHIASALSTNQRTPLTDQPESSSSEVPMSNWKRFLSLVKIFKTDCDVNEYFELISQLKFLGQLTSVEQYAVLTYIVLFDNNDTLNVIQYETLEDIEMLNTIIFETIIQSDDDFRADAANVQSVISVLQSMAVFCAHNVDWSGSLAESEVDDMPTHMTMNVVMPYTGEEEAWLKKQIALVDDAFRSVPVGESLMHEFMMYSLGVPLSKSYMGAFFSILRERIWRIFKVHPEFDVLPSECQLRALTENGFSGIALMTVKAECCQTGMDQLHLGFGEGDESSWRTNYNSVFDLPEKIRKMSMTNNNLFAKDQVAVYSALFNENKDFVNDPILYKINLLMALFQKSPRGGADNGLSNLFSKYSTVTRRRLEWQKKNKRSAVTGSLLYSTPEQVLARMNQIVQALNKIAHLLLQVGQ